MGALVSSVSLTAFALCALIVWAEGAPPRRRRCHRWHRRSRACLLAGAPLALRVAGVAGVALVLLGLHQYRAPVPVPVPAAALLAPE